MIKEPKLYTPVSVDKAFFSIGQDDKLMLLGSCFTENMGTRLNSLGFSVNVNPFGVLYNPLSMALALQKCLDNEPVVEEDLVFHDGLWHSWLHHGAFSHADRQQCLHQCNSAIGNAHAFLSSCNTIILTFGSAWLYRITSDRFGTKYCDAVVANCHKIPASCFRLDMASVDDVVSVWQPLCERLLNEGRRIIFTVSPVRHGAYGAHGNQIGKAVLLLSIEHLMRTMEMHKLQMNYFPSYEILMDELRDYRFYADDLLHPSGMAEQIIWQRFQSALMSPQTIAYCEQRDKENRRAAHRQLHNSVDS